MSLVWTTDTDAREPYSDPMLERKLWGNLGRLPDDVASGEVRKTLHELTQPSTDPSPRVVLPLMRTKLLLRCDATTVDEFAAHKSRCGTRGLSPEDAVVLGEFARYEDGLRIDDSYIYPNCWGIWFMQQLRSIPSYTPAGVALDAFQQQVFEERFRLHHGGSAAEYLPLQPLRAYLPRSGPAAVLRMHGVRQLG